MVNSRELVKTTLYLVSNLKRDDYGSKGIREMKSKLEDIRIDPDNPFANCKLDRAKYAHPLREIVKTYSDGCVLAINGKWGTGKTTFVKMWQNYLEKYDIQTLYYNAWENDFVSDPLVSLLGELNKFNKVNGAKEKMEGVVSAAGKIFLEMTPAIARGVVKKVSGIDAEEIGNIIRDGVASGSAMLKHEIEKYQEQKSTLEHFRGKLKDLVETVCNDNPLVFIVDELDRCNPAFAVKVLERIKHLFDVPNIVFVLSIDKEQLYHSICGYYGSESIDAQEYLRRFIDIEFSLPQPNAENFCNYLYDYYEFDDFFKNQERLNYFRNRDEATSFIKMARELMSYMNLPLRTVDRIFSNTRLALRMFSYSNYVHEKMLFILVYLRICKSSMYIRMCQHDYTLQEFVNEIEDLFPKEMLRYDFETHSFYYVLALLILCYNLDENEHEIEKLCEVENGKTTRLCISFQYIDEEQIRIAIENWKREFNGGAIGLKFFFEKIDLLSTLRN